MVRVTPFAVITAATAVRIPALENRNSRPALDCTLLGRLRSVLVAAKGSFSTPEKEVLSLE